MSRQDADADTNESECMDIDCEYDETIDTIDFELSGSDTNESSDYSEFSSNDKKEDEPTYDNDESLSVNEEAVMMILSF